MFTDDPITCTQYGYTYVNIDDYDGVVEVVSPGYYEEGICYANDLDCRFVVYTDNGSSYIEMGDSEHEVRKEHKIHVVYISQTFISVFVFLVSFVFLNA